MHPIRKMVARRAAVLLAAVALAAGIAGYAAALLISVSILRDGIKNLRGAVGALIDTRAHTVDDSAPDPLNRRIDTYLKGLPWVKAAASRVRDEGHVFHIESFVVPAGDTLPSLQASRKHGKNARRWTGRCRTS